MDVLSLATHKSHPRSATAFTTSFCFYWLNTTRESIGPTCIMSRSNNSLEDERSRPSFSGDSMPMNVNLAGMDEGAEETSRRITFQPSFEPISTFQPPAISETRFIGTTKPSRPSHVVEQPKKTAKRGIWQLREIPTLPELYDLEQTAVFVPHSYPEDVSARISEVLRERSIEATYDDEAAKAKCLTADGVDFRVRLFRGKGSYHHGVIVEVQRRYGTSNIFYEDIKAILDAAEDKVAPPPPSLSQSTSALPLPPGMDSVGDSVLRPSSSLEMVSKMLNHRGYDTKNLALQMLVSLTDESKIGGRTAVAVSKEFLKLDDANEVAGSVLSLILDKKADDDVSKLRALAFQAAANAFQAVKGRVSTILKEQFRFIIVDELRQAEKTPRVALQAARIAEFLVPEDTGSDLHNALETAVEVGAARHAALQRQAQLCLDKFV